MSSKPWVAALLWILAVVTLTALPGSTATTTPIGSTASPYSDCPPPSSPLVGCDCEYDESNNPVVTIWSIDGDIDSCMANLSDSGHTTLYSLDVSDYPPLNLTKDIFRDLQFEYLTFYDTTIVNIDKSFLGNSRNFTRSLFFVNCPLLQGITQFEADVLYILGLSGVFDQSQLNPILKNDVFSGTPALEMLSIVSYDERILTVQRHAFRSLTKLWDVNLLGSVRFLWGSGHFPAPGLTRLWLGNSREGVTTTIDAGPGTFSGIQAWADVAIYGKVIGGWQRSKFFNILRGGAVIRRDGVEEECGCDMAWIWYSSFLKQVDVSCYLGDGTFIPLPEMDLSHCRTFKDRSPHNTEL